jgi:hypothetical protein
MKRLPRILKALFLLGLLGFAAMLIVGYARSHPEDMPWTALDLSRPIGAFTGRKLAALSGEGEQCRRLLGQAGIPLRRLAAAAGKRAVRL